MKSPDSAMGAPSSSTPSTPSSRIEQQARRVWMLLAWAIVFATTVLAAVFFVVGIEPYFQHITTVCYTATCTDDQLPAPIVAQLTSAGISITAYAVYLIALQSIYVLTTLAVVAVLLWRRASDGFALFTALTLVVWISFVVDAPAVLADNNSAWGVVSALFAFASFPCFTLFFLLFPSGRFAPGILRWVELGFAALSVIVFLGAHITVGNLSAAAYLVLFIVWFGSIIAVQVYRYRRTSTPTQRQQTKWVVFGLVVALLGFMLLLAIQVVLSGGQSGLLNTALNGVYYPFELLVPLSIGIAILRSHLYDIDVLINRALVYGSLTAILALVYIAGVVGAQTLVNTIARAPAGQTSPVLVVVTTLAIAALFQPLRRRLQRTIDRRFYRRKYSVERTLAAFSTTLRQEVDLSDLQEQLLRVIQKTMEPAALSLWLRTPVDSTRDHIRFE